MKILKLILSLTVISGVCAAVLAAVNGVTREQIARIAEITRENAAKAVMPASVARVDREEHGGETLYVGKDAGGAVVAYAAPGADAKGYGGEVRLMVGLTPDLKVVSYRKLVANETPGLGAKLATPEFAGQFGGKDARALKVRKDGGDVEAITAATITSRAVCAAIADAARKVAALK